jgi:hypothetical protein
MTRGRRRSNLRAISRTCFQQHLRQQSCETIFSGTTVPALQKKSVSPLPPIATQNGVQPRIVLLRVFRAVQHADLFDTVNVVAPRWCAAKTTQQPLDHRWRANWRKWRVAFYEIEIETKFVVTKTLYETITSLRTTFECRWHIHTIMPTTTTSKYVVASPSVKRYRSTLRASPAIVRKRPAGGCRSGSDPGLDVSHKP